MFGIFVVITGLVALTLSGFLRVDRQVYAGKEFELRKLSEIEIAGLKSNSEKGDCVSAYKLGRYHMFFSFDQAQAIRYFRIASTCPNANAMSSLISLLINDPNFDSEVDQLLKKIRKLDITMAESAEIEVSLRRKAR